MRGRGDALKAVILAGGEGTRLRPLTLKLPKPTTPIVDRPLLQHQLEMLGRAVAEDGLDALRLIREREDDLVDAGAAQHLELVLEKRTIDDGRRRLGELEGQ